MRIDTSRGHLLLHHHFWDYECSKFGTQRWSVKVNAFLHNVVILIPTSRKCSLRIVCDCPPCLALPLLAAPSSARRRLSLLVCLNRTRLQCHRSARLWESGVKLRKKCETKKKMSEKVTKKIKKVTVLERNEKELEEIRSRNKKKSCNGVTWRNGLQDFGD